MVNQWLSLFKMKPVRTVRSICARAGGEGACIAVVRIGCGERLEQSDSNTLSICWSDGWLDRSNNNCINCTNCIDEKGGCRYAPRLTLLSLM